MGCTGSKSVEDAVEVENPSRSQQGASNGAPSDNASSVTRDKEVVAALKAKRRGIFGENVDVTKDYQKRVIQKSEAQKAVIMEAVKKNFLFASLREAELHELTDAMAPVTCEKDKIVIKQGDPKGDYFYVIENGQFDIIVDGNVVTVFGDGTPNKSFGELALLYNSPRAATVRAKTDAKLWALDRMTFRSILATTSHNETARIKTALRRSDLLKDLGEEKLTKLATAMTPVSFNSGEHIIKKGDIGDVFYLIESGQVIVKNIGQGQSDNTMTAGDYFGDRALLKDEPRAADVFAKTDVKLLALHRDDFHSLLGELAELLHYNLGMRVLLCVELFKNLSDKEREVLITNLETLAYQQGDTIIAEGQPNDTFYIIKDGVVSLRKGDGGPDRTLKMGMWFGEKELLSKAPAEWSVIAEVSGAPPIGVGVVC